jgi:predicted transcriptional regulator
MNIKEHLLKHFEEKEVNGYFEELTKISNITKNSYEKSRELILLCKDYPDENKLKMLKMLDVLYVKNNKKINTSNYDNKAYCQMFFEDFLAFLDDNQLSINELKVIFSIYKILNESNTYGNILINLNQKYLSEITKIDASNLSKVIKKLIDKNLLKKENKNIYLNYNYFFRGSKVDYDLYGEIYSHVISEDNSNK